MKLPHHLTLDPTRIVMDVRFTVDGGDIRHDATAAVRNAVVLAYKLATRTAKLKGGLTLSTHSIPPKRFETMLKRKFPQDYIKPEAGEEGV